MGESIQYILVRKDLDMSHGKMAAQVAHASIGAVAIECQRRLVCKQNLEDFKKDRNSWFENSFAKVVLEVKTKQKMLNIMDRLLEDGIPHSIIRDACRTELKPEENGCTMTCIGIAPMFRERIPKYIRNLQIYI
jgi:PTH2 family peptidyl-tRNA hydrolase